MARNLRHWVMGQMLQNRVHQNRVHQPEKRVLKMPAEQLHWQLPLHLERQLCQQLGNHRRSLATEGEVVKQAMLFEFVCLKCNVGKLLPPPKGVMFTLRCVCLFVCPPSYGRNSRSILMKLCTVDDWYPKSKIEFVGS